MKVKKSLIWKYFVVVDDDYAKCTICDKNYSRKGRTTTSLKGHLKSMHQEKYNEFCLLDEVQRQTEKSDVTSTPSLKTITSQQIAGPNNQAWDAFNSKDKEIDKLIGEMLALQNLPFNFVDGLGFRRVLHAALPNYHLRDSQFFTSYVYDELYTNMSKKIDILLEKLTKLSITTDICSDLCANVTFVSFIAHGITEEFKRLHIVSKCYPLHDRITDDVMSEQIRIMLRDSHIHDQKVHCFFHNSGSKFASDVNLTNIAGINCTIYQLKLCVNAVLESPELKDLMLKCQSISTHFKSSEIAQEELHLIQTEHFNQPGLQVIEDCNKRLNSNVYMIKRLISIKDSICMYADLHNIPKISAEEWLHLNIIMTILRPFEEITQILSDTKTSISSVIPLIHVLKHTLHQQKDNPDKTRNFNNTIINKVIEHINSKFGELQSNYLYALATYLDPRYKLKFFNEIVKNNVESELLRLLTLHNEFCEDTKDFEHVFVESESEDSMPSVQKKLKVEPNTVDDQPNTSSQIDKSQSIQFNLAKMMTNSSDEEDNTTILSQIEKWKSLINEYSKRKRIKPNEDPLVWWKVNTKFQAFTPIVRAFLSPPAGLATTKQLLSEDDFISDSLNNRLEGNKIAKLLFIKQNLLLLDFDF